MRYRRAGIGIGMALVALLAVGCSPEDRGARTDVAGPPRVESAREVAANVGRVVEAEGVAENAKAGAVVVLNDQSPVYLEGRAEWPATIVKTRVRVTGTVVKHAGLHDARVGGIQEDYYTLRDASWKAARGGE